MRIRLIAAIFRSPRSTLPILQDWQLINPYNVLALVEECLIGVFARAQKIPFNEMIVNQENYLSVAEYGWWANGRLVVLIKTTHLTLYLFVGTIKS